MTAGHVFLNSTNALFCVCMSCNKLVSERIPAYRQFKIVELYQICFRNNETERILGILSRFDSSFLLINTTSRIFTYCECSTRWWWNVTQCVNGWGVRACTISRRLTWMNNGSISLQNMIQMQQTRPINTMVINGYDTWIFMSVNANLAVALWVVLLNQHFEQEALKTYPLYWTEKLRLYFQQDFQNASRPIKNLQ